jgi:DNA-binding transcriptional ArsR family regulator
LNTATRERASQLFAALSNPSRLRIVELLCRVETAGGREGIREVVGNTGLSVNEISATLSLGQSATSQHLATLTRAGVLVVEPRGTSRIYRMRGPRIARILALIEEFCQVHELYGLPSEEEEGADESRGKDSVQAPDAPRERTGSLP